MYMYIGVSNDVHNSAFCANNCALGTALYALSLFFIHMSKVNAF